MAETKKASQQDIFTRGEEFYQKNKKAISIGVSVVLVAVIGIIAFNNFYLPSKEKEAQEQMFKAQQYFEQDSFRLALNGDGNYSGFLAIMDDYKFTKAACLAHYYSGISYLKLGEYDEAIKHLKKFDGDEPIVESVALGAIGDAYSEKNEMDEAINYYKKAAKESDNGLIVPYYLFKAGVALKVQGKTEEALEIFRQIKDEYPDSNEGKEVEKYLPAAG